MMIQKTNTLKKIPALGCCLVSILLNQGFSLSIIASEVGVSQRTLRRVLLGHPSSLKTKSALVNFYLHTCIHSDL
jgi:hypothetical protein